MVNLKLYAWVVRGRQRIAIIKSMHKPMTVTKICKNSKQYNQKVSLNNCSDVVRSFAKTGLAICLNSHDRTGRLYKLTDKGEKIREELLNE
jgi:predicted transcriptional regulator